MTSPVLHDGYMAICYVDHNLLLGEDLWFAKSHLCVMENPFSIKKILHLSKFNNPCLKITSVADFH